MDKQGTIQYAISGNTCVVRLEGRVTYQQGPAFNTFADSLCGNTSVRSLIIDLRPTTYMDSTILGILAKLSIYSQKALQSRLMVISPNEDINLILRNSGFDDVFTLLNHIPPKDEWVSLPLTPPDSKNQAQVILEAHRALMDLSDENRLRFSDVVDLLDKEIHHT